MRTLATILALATASLSLAQTNLEDWKVRYYFTGSQTTVIDGQASTTDYNDQETQGVGRGEMFKGPGHPVSASSSLVGKWRVHVKWTGRGNPPQRMFLRIQSTATANWGGTGGSDSASNGLDGPVKHYGQQLGDTVVSDSHSSFPLSLTNGETDRQVSINSSAQCFAVMGSVGSTASISAYVTPRRVTTASDPGPTVHRLPGGIPEFGGFQDSTGVCRVDRSYQVSNFLGEIKGKFFEKMVGQTEGDWDYPIVSFDWSGLSFKWVNKFWNSGKTEAWNWEEYVDKQQLIRGFAGPDIRHATSKISDRRGQEDASFSFYTHSPVERTGEKWKADINGTALSKVPEARASGFVDAIIGSISNYSDQPIQATVTISTSASYTYGAQATYGGSTGFEWEIVKASFSASVTKSSSETYTVGRQYSVGVNLAPGTSLSLVAVPMGSAAFPICSHWNSGGWSGDGNYFDAIAGYIDYRIYIKKVDPWQ